MIDRRKFLLGTASGLAGFAIHVHGFGSAEAAPIKNVSYGSNRLDIYPAASADAPVLAYAHGGAWRLGDRGTVGSMPGYFNPLGYTFVSIGYSLRASVDGQARDVANAVNWIKANIGQYGGNGERVALMGHSAGCHLSCLATLSGLTSPSALIANDTAAYDVAYLAEINHGRLPFLYAQPFSDRSKWRQWSPYTYVGGAGSLPVLVAWSGGENRDRVSIRFAEALAAAGHPVTRFDGSRGYSHLSIRNAVGKRDDPLTARITEFLRAYV
jgi:acetyl esterase/lipase